MAGTKTLSATAANPCGTGLLAVWPVMSEVSACANARLSSIVNVTSLSPGREVGQFQVTSRTAVLAYR